jgi:hypothetical protein
MPERISITYTIELGDLNLEIQRLYREMTSSIEHLSDSCTSPDDLLSESTIRELSRISESLKNISYKVSDIENIVKSYLNYITQSENSNNSQQLQQLQNLANKLSDLNDEDTASRS